MNRHRVLVVLTVIALFVFGIGAMPAVGKAMPERPIEGFLTGSAHNVFPDGTGPFEDFCEQDQWVLTQADATGEVDHLGLTETTEFWHCYGGGLLVGAATLEAANGDTVGGGYVGELVFGEDGSIRSPLTLTISHGTGRFDDASGTLHLDVLVLPGPTGVNIEVTVTGTISY